MNDWFDDYSNDYRDEDDWPYPTDENNDDIGALDDEDWDRYSGPYYDECGYCGMECPFNDDAPVLMWKCPDCGAWLNTHYANRLDSLYADVLPKPAYVFIDYNSIDWEIPF